MSDLISRQAAIEALEEQLDYLQMLNKYENPTAESKWYGVNWARNTIADLPSAQPEIIRCKDCKYNATSKKCLNPNSFFLVPTDDDFCSYAERREVNNESN